MSVIVVLGMHKSGTTLVAETLHRSGIPMIGSEAAGGYDDGNKMERDETRFLNNTLLEGHGVESLRLRTKFAPSAVLPEHISEARRIVAKMGDARWGFKDPRTLITFDFWGKVLPDPVLVGVYRNPIEVFGHYMSRAGRLWISRDPAYLPSVLRAWCVYNSRLLEIKRAYPGMFLIDYGDLMNGNAGMKRLSEYIGQDLMDCRQTNLKRAEAKGNVHYRLAQGIVNILFRMDSQKIYSELKDSTVEGEKK
jgi:hypothetical protein